MFVKTKDGVYEVKVNKYHELVYCKDNQIVLSCNILKQSENLEELCDEFVLYDNQLKTYGVFDKKVITFKWIQNHSTIYKGMTIYGAIWTDKGLIYVAKMNENGELVLI